MTKYLFEQATRLTEQYEDLYYVSHELLTHNDYHTSEPLTPEQISERSFNVRTYVVESNVMIQMLAKRLEEEQKKSILQRIKEKLTF